MPSVLLVCGSLRRNSTARLPYALKKAGFDVWVICPNAALVRFSDFIDGGRAYHDKIDYRVLGETICDFYSECRPDLIVACDEGAMAGLDRVRGLTLPHPEYGAVKRLLDRWSDASDGVVSTRSLSVERVRRMGVRVPRQTPIVPAVTAASDLVPLGSPVVVKQDGTCGGGGVSVVPTFQGAIDAASHMAMTRKTDTGESRVVAQEFIRGQAAAVSFCALEGRVLESFAYATVRHYPEPNGPASVVEVKDLPELSATARRIVEQFGYSGFGGIDFILPDDAGAPVFLEFNARPTQTTHLGSLFGADLCRAMACALTGQSYARAAEPLKPRSIAMFPSEWIRDRNSAHLFQSYHDIPWHEQRLMAVTMGMSPGILPN